ncbi:hypothetical protein AB0H51_28235 [Streptomyces griseoluteus]|uniref:hypothetical protein n=1 Tax=Streptomyces griseoluteus TaxID=29306 RepID=UPI003401468C
MNRTLGDTARRRVLVDAAGGFDDRASVVLYACIAPGQDQDDVLARLRRHAEARDWLVAAVVVDHDPTATPLDYRQNWWLAQEYVTTGQARGIVATPGTDRAGALCARPLADWLHDQHAFLSVDASAAEGAAR